MPIFDNGEQRGVANKRLVIDANIVIRAIFGNPVRALIERFCETTAFYIAEANLEEAVFYTAEIGVKHGIAESIRVAALESLMTMIQVIPDDDLQQSRERAATHIYNTRPLP